MKVNLKFFVAYASVAFLSYVGALDAYVKHRHARVITMNDLALPPRSHSPNRSDGKLPADLPRAAYFGRCGVALQNLAETLADQADTLLIGTENLPKQRILSASEAMETLSKRMDKDGNSSTFDGELEAVLIARDFPGQNRRLIDFAAHCIQVSHEYGS